VSKARTFRIVSLVLGGVLVAAIVAAVVLLGVSISKKRQGRNQGTLGVGETLGNASGGGAPAPTFGGRRGRPSGYGSDGVSPVPPLFAFPDMNPSYGYK